jgi:hypothetical protein
MPSEHQHSTTATRERYPELRDDIGEDPARFLDYDLVQNEAKRELALARIRGIDKIAKVRGWIAVERGLNRPMRTGIIRALEEREDELEEIGERPDRLAFGPRRPPSFFESDESGEEPDEKDLTARQKLNRMRARADGGEVDAE